MADNQFFHYILLTLFISAINVSNVHADTFQKSFEGGWHLISIPCQPSSSDQGSFFESQFDEVFAFNNNSYLYDELLPLVTSGAGYWVHFASDTTVMLSGSPVATEFHNVQVFPGWNIIGMPFKKDAQWSASTINGEPVLSSEMVQSDLYQYDPSQQEFSTADTLKQWSGYFVKTSATATLAIRNMGDVVSINFVDSGQQLGAYFTSEIHVADFDADSDIDFIEVIQNSPNRIWFNSGDGTFSDSGQTLGSFSYAAVADMDNDGDVDIVDAAGTGGSIIWTNDGSGSFSDSGHRFNDIGTSFIHHIVIADTDNDGDNDVIIASQYPQYLTTIWLNTGSANFIDSGIRFEKHDTASIYTFDYDNDRDVDMVEALKNSSEFSIWTNNGFGSFASQSVNTSTDNLGKIVPSDVNGDGFDDLILGRWDDLSNSVWMNNGNGGFSDSGQSLGSYSTMGLIPCDFDIDGDMDYVELVGVPRHWFHFWSNLGNGVFTEIYSMIGSGGGPFAMADVDGDGDIDLIEGNIMTYPNRVLLQEDREISNNPPSSPSGLSSSVDGTSVSLSWTPGADIETPSASLTYNLLVSLTSGITSNAKTAVFSGNAGHTSSWNLRNLLPGTTYYYSVQTVDAGYEKSAWVTEASFTTAGSAVQSIEISPSSDCWLDPGAETQFSAQCTRADSSTFACSSEPGWTVTGTLGAVSMDSDGTLTAGMTGGTSNVKMVIGTVESNSVAVSVRGFYLAGQLAGNDNTVSILAADFDGDGDSDIAEGGKGEKNAIWINSGSGEFTNSGQTFSEVYTRSIFAADLDNDGDIDLYEGVKDSSNLIWINDGSGVFSDSGQQIGNKSTTTISAADFDNDGDIDLFDGYTYESCSLWNNVEGSFILQKEETCDFTLSAVVPADIDKDGDIDLVMDEYTWKNNGAFSFTSSENSFSNSVSLLSADVDNDGDPDILKGNDYSGFKLYLNDGTGEFSESGLLLSCYYPDVSLASDVDNDGDYDFIMSAAKDGTKATQVWKNDASGMFQNTGQILGGYSSITCAAAADFNEDGYVDFVNGDEDSANRLWFNISDTQPNTPPVAPTGLSSSVNTDSATLSWSASSDTQTPASLMSYNIDVSVTPGNTGSDVSPQLFGAIAGTESWRFDGLMSGQTYYWSVHGVDSGLLQSAWSPEQSFTVSGSLLSSIQITPGPEVWLDRGAQQQFTVECTRADLSTYDCTSGISWIVEGDSNAGTMDKTGLFTASELNGGTVWIKKIIGSIESEPVKVSVRGFRDSGQWFGGNGASSLFSFDADGDNDNDLLIGFNYDPNRLVFNNGEGTFSDSGNIFSDSHASYTYADDFDKDGDIDIFEGGGNYESNRVWMNDGSGVFTDSGQTLGDYYIDAVTGADINNDGNVDIIQGIGGDGNTIWLNSGAGVFSDSGQSIGPKATNDIVAIDYDIDGDVDIIEGNYDLQGNCIWLNDGTGAFSDFGQSLGSNRTLTIAAFDIDNDGDIDIVDDVKIWLNNSNSFSDSGQTVGNSTTRKRVFPVDVDNDGDKDLILGTDSFSYGTMIFINDGTGTFSDSGHILYAGSNSQAVFAADFNNDGYIDFAEGYDQGLSTKDHFLLWLQVGDSGANSAPGNIPATQWGLPLFK